MPRIRKRAKPEETVRSETPQETAPAAPAPEAVWRREQRMALGRLRQHLQLTQKQLGERVGMSMRSVTRFESGADVIPFRVVKKLMDLAAGQPGLEADLHWWGVYLKVTLLEETGPSNIENYIAGRGVESRGVADLRAFLVLWDVFHPQLTPAEERIYIELTRRLKALIEDLIPEKEICCWKCGQSDQTQLIRDRRGEVIGGQHYFCTRCQTLGDLEQHQLSSRNLLTSVID